MKKLSKIKLHDAVELEDREMKMIFGGSGATHTCLLKCGSKAGIEPVIGHLKEDHRLSRNYYKGITGDEINVMLAAAGFNFKRMMNKWKSSFWLFLEKIIVFLNRQLHPIRDSIILQTI